MGIAALTLAQDGLALALGALAFALVFALLEALDRDQLGAMFKGGLRTQLQRIDLTPLLGQMLSAAIADRRHLPVLDSLLRWAGVTLEANEALVRGVIHDRANAPLYAVKRAQPPA